MASPNFAGSEPEWESVILSEASVPSEGPEPAEIVWVAPDADSTISGMTQLQVETLDERVAKVRFEIDGTPLGDPVEPDE